ncbi:hypothetical protein [Streptomyces sp. NPDC048442]|uniref:hypothetical protein n=1 Tax=Streptomyces sp. NPDC048442 TaxID=3154823 RepID=UPI00343CA51E
MERTKRKIGSGWIIPPLFVFFVGAMLTSVVSHAVDGSTHTTVMIVGFSLDAIAVIWAVVRWMRANNANG